MNTDSLGRMGEESAASYLCGKRFRILGRNVHSRHFETDIIAANDQYIIFAEVKTRRAFPASCHPFGRPAAAVTPRKQERLIAAAADYLQKHRESLAGLQPRIDVIEVYISPCTEEYKVLHIEHLPGAVRRRTTT
ncbi:MAG: YraN family protein [Clostridiales bacterium]|nr:YraN family protein [Clostridiales bacterium]